MTDPMAPDGYTFENQDKLIECVSKLREHAQELEDLSFGNASADIQRVLYQIEQHLTEDGWTRLSRAALNYARRNVQNLPLPSVSVRHPFEGEPTKLCISLGVTVPLTDGETVGDFMAKWDPGNPFDKTCPTCHVDPKHPCQGPVPEGLDVHAARRFV